MTQRQITVCDRCDRYINAYARVTNYRRQRIANARAIVAEEDAERTRRICEALAKGWASRRSIAAGDRVRILESAFKDGAEGATGIFTEMWKGDYFVKQLDRPCSAGERWAYARRVERVA